MLVMAILLHQPLLAKKVIPIPREWEELFDEESELLVSMLRLLEEAPDLTPSELREWLEGQKTFDHAALKDCEKKVRLIPNEGVEAELTGAIKQISAIGQAQFTEQLLQKAKTTDLSAEEKDRLREILKIKGNQ